MRDVREHETHYPDISTQVTYIKQSRFHSSRSQRFVYERVLQLSTLSIQFLTGPLIQLRVLGSMTVQPNDDSLCFKNMKATKTPVPCRISVKYKWTNTIESKKKTQLREKMKMKAKTRQPARGASTTVQWTAIYLKPELASE